MSEKLYSYFYENDKFQLIFLSKNLIFYAQLYKKMFCIFVIIQYVGEIITDHSFQSMF